jgi:predicted hydrocarbon binding protein
MKLKIGINAMAETFNKTSDQIVRVEEAPDHFLYHIDRCPVCWGRHAEQPICHAGLGLLQEGLHWVTSGKNIRVEEIKCIAMGDPACTYVIVKRPLD